MKSNITILCSYGLKEDEGEAWSAGILFFYSLYPLLKKKFGRISFHITKSLEYCLKKDPNPNLILIRFLPKEYSEENSRKISEVMQLLRPKYQKIALFDDEDGTAISYPAALPFVDIYFHKQLLKDREQYLHKMYRGQLFPDYFYRKFGIRDERAFFSQSVSRKHFRKLRLAWNLGAGCYPRRNLRRHLGVLGACYVYPGLARCFYTHPEGVPFPENKERYDIHARFGKIAERATVGFQREQMLRLVWQDLRFLTGTVAAKQYQLEMKHSKMVLSPFGWGEVCYRDFEAILNGALLLKPDMSHIETWPDVYKPYETYIPLKWDGSDLEEKAVYYLKNDEERRRIARNAFNSYQDALKILGRRAGEVVRLLTG